MQLHVAPILLLLTASVSVNALPTRYAAPLNELLRSSKCSQYLKG